MAFIYIHRQPFWNGNKRLLGFSKTWSEKSTYNVQPNTPLGIILLLLAMFSKGLGPNLVMFLPHHFVPSCLSSVYSFYEPNTFEKASVLLEWQEDMTEELFALDKAKHKIHLNFWLTRTSLATNGSTMSRLGLLDLSQGSPCHQRILLTIYDWLWWDICSGSHNDLLSVSTGCCFRSSLVFQTDVKNSVLNYDLLDEVCVTPPLSTSCFWA